ncbi:hypothetical protein E2C01_087267 [Portunus trituberculatus]|uniref:Uncharacterized protein n=1 Tax=Portunus trituberculatus TaxID=210409 RepID=A0A5B7JCV9_PORTR|nr:hypothetical protein [Portunus trituberculatus]
MVLKNTPNKATCCSVRVAQRHDRVKLITEVYDRINCSGTGNKLLTLLLTWQTAAPEQRETRPRLWAMTAWIQRGHGSLTVTECTCLLSLIHPCPPSFFPSPLHYNHSSVTLPPTRRCILSVPSNGSKYSAT